MTTPQPVYEDDVESSAAFLEKFQMAFRESAVTVMRQAFEDWLQSSPLRLWSVVKITTEV